MIKIREEGRSDTAANETVKRDSFFSIASRFENLDRVAVANINSRFLEKHEQVQIEEQEGLAKQSLMTGKTPFKEGASAEKSPSKLSQQNSKKDSQLLTKSNMKTQGVSSFVNF